MYTVLIILAIVCFPLPCLFGWVGFSIFGATGAVAGVLFGLVLAD